MNNLPENENNFNEEFSTVFADPTAHENGAEKGKKKKPLKIILSLFLAVAVLCGGTFAVVKLIPEREEATKQESKTIKVLNYKTDDIKEVNIKNQNGSFKFLSQVVETTNTASQGSETTKETVWYADGYDKELISTNYIKQIIDTVCTVSAVREIENKTDAECGFDSPVATVEILDKKGKNATLTVGKKSPDNIGAYVKVLSTDKVFIVGSDFDTSLSFTDLDFASTENMPSVKLDPEKYEDYFNYSNLVSCDTISLSGKSIPQKLVFKAKNSDENIATFFPYSVIEPVKREANNVDKLFSAFSSGIAVTGAYSYEISNARLKQFGLDDPDIILTAKFRDVTYTYKFKKQSDGDYAVVNNDSKNIKRVSPESCLFLDLTTTDYFSDIVFMTSIEGVANLTLKTPEKEYSFGIKETETGSKIDQYIITYENDDAIKSQNFQTFYQYLCSLSCIDFETENISNKPDLSIIYTYDDANIKPTKLDFVKVDALKCQYYLDGVPMGKISAVSYNKILQNLEKLVAGKQIVIN